MATTSSKSQAKGTRRLARVLARHDRAPGVFEIEVEREGLDYSPGDCTLLIGKDNIDSRPYSFSSHPDESVLRFLIRRMSFSGSRASFSQWLSDLKPGDEVGVGTPFGWFRPGHSENEVWFATGTGVSPFLAALRAHRPLRPRSLYFGVRSADDAILAPWLEDHAPVKWAFSRVGASARRVTDYTSEVPIEPEIRYFLCGNLRMIEAVAAALKQRGVLPSQIHEELFFQ